MDAATGRVDRGELVFVAQSRLARMREVAQVGPGAPWHSVYRALLRASVACLQRAATCLLLRAAEAPTLALALPRNFGRPWA